MGCKEPTPGPAAPVVPDARVEDPQTTPNPAVVVETTRSPAVALEDREQLWSRLTQAKLEPRQIETPVDIFSYLALSPDGSKIHAYRYRETVDHTLLSDLVEIDVAKGGAPRVLADTGSDDYFLEYAQAVEDTKLVLYASRSVVKYKTHRILRLELPAGGPTAVVAGDTAAGVVDWFAPTPDGLIYERDRTLFALPWGSNPVTLVPQAAEDLGDLEPVAEGRAMFARIENREEETGTYFIVAWEAGFTSPVVQRVLQEDGNRSVDIFGPWTEQEAVFVEIHDSNGDGKADYLDENADTLSAVSLADGTVRKLAGGALNVSWVKGHPSGLVMYVHEDLARATSSLRVLDPVSGAEHELGVVKGQFGDWSISADWTRIVYAVISDTNDDGDYYPWDDQSRLYVSSL
ncbi:hypothetical protein DB30_04881 [Enhygromyxa salina]|uniref:Uncharacterized protein n=1 Tax=Enhygromyxa salina TaxID=215803 RepID=A0A0C1ZY27_9BACT|nr:hypothetical protein DB30_04881 [Enhygromyxa salina]